jgi:hypothetical protein
VLHPERWDRWQIWLQFMCDILSDDWSQRQKEFDATQERKKEELQNSGPTQEELNILRQSLIFQYISSGARNGNTRRIIRSIFSDGSTASVNEFREVFDKELVFAKSQVHTAKAKKREREVNIDKEQYGDYLSEDSDDASISGLSRSQSRASTPLDDVPKVRRSKRTRRGTRNASDLFGTDGAQDASDAGQGHLTQHGGGVSQMGGLDSLGLRKKLLGILSRVSTRLPKDFIQTDYLYQSFVEHIRHQPLPVFQALVNPLVLPEIDDEAQTTLGEYLVFSMIESAAPTSGDNRLTPEKLEHCFLPYAAATASVADNAKFSVLLESLVTLLADRGWIKQTSSLRAAVERGIKHRTERALQETHRSQASQDKVALEWSWLLESGDRIVFLIDLLPAQ